MAIYIDWAGKKPAGNVTAEGFKDQIEIHSLQWGVGRAISMITGNAANREASQPSFSEFTISKSMDTATVGLFEKAAYGSTGDKVIITVVKTGADKVDTFVTYTLHNVLVSSYSMSTGGDLPSESLSLSYTKIEMEVVAGSADNKDGKKLRTGYDVGAGKKL